MSTSNKLLQAASGGAGEAVYVDDVFSTDLYTGNGSVQSIDNGIDLAGEGGLVWVKNRGSAQNHVLTDTLRGDGTYLSSNTTAGNTSGGGIFLGDGFAAISSSALTNATNNTYASWTFRKAKKFFDVVTWTGNGTAGRTVSHNLNSVPGMIIVKRTDSTNGWPVYHRAMDSSSPQNYVARLNAADARFSATRWNNTAPTSTVFTLGDNDEVNGSGATYVAYIFAHDDQSFGDNSDEAIIKCGSYTGTGSAVDVSLGFEPQWIMFKRSDSIGDWLIYDVMRGIVTGGSDERLEPNTSDAAASSVACEVTATGFTVTSTGTYMNASGGNYIYIAIRRPMKTPEAGTEVFHSNKFTTTGFTEYTGVGFAPDISIQKAPASTDNWEVVDKLRGASAGLKLNTTDGESTDTLNLLGGFLNNGVKMGTAANGQWNGWNPNLHYYFKRATGFFDVVAYEGNGSPSNTVRRDLKHNLGVTPELAILKRRDSTSEWQVGVNGTSLYLNLSNGSAGTYTHSSYFNATDFDVEGWVTEANNNVSGSDYIVYLFATLDGVSKVGSYTGTGSNVDVDCGFSAGARFILIKRTDSTGDWYVWDSVRGIVAGNDPYLLLNSTAAEVTSTDYIDPLSSGFTVTSSAPAGLNASGGSYIFLAIS